MNKAEDRRLKGVGQKPEAAGANTGTQILRGTQDDRGGPVGDGSSGKPPEKNTADKAVARGTADISRAHPTADKAAAGEYNVNGTPRTWVTIRVPLGPNLAGERPTVICDVRYRDGGPQAVAFKRIKAAICHSQNQSDLEVIKWLLGEVARQLG